jgi:hypothetical protein
MAEIQKQWIVTGPEGHELLISFWGGMDADPEVASRIDHTRWGAPLPVREVTYGGAA